LITNCVESTIDQSESMVQRSCFGNSMPVSLTPICLPMTYCYQEIVSGKSMPIQPHLEILVVIY